ncbi:HutD family protein [Massilia sp. W12]|uniref:HutD/Ves family protein n=1 Tax=Massilia sp. W12 TaxID=3126507 RepID=UPI0030D2A679
MAHLYMAADYQDMPWKNGGGSTAQILIHPKDAGIDDFIWRISLATIAEDGPFSSFPGIARSLALVAGAGVDLHFSTRRVCLRPDGERLISFDGADSVHATLADGVTRDFNVMTRDVRAHHSCQIWQLHGAMEWRRNAPDTLIFVQSGQVQCAWGQSSQRLREFDSLMLQAGDDARCQLMGEACLFIVELWERA